MNAENLIIRMQDAKAVDFSVQLMKTGTDFLEKQPHGDMVLDLTDCRTVDSRTIGAIVNLTNRFSRQKRAFILRNANTHIRKILDFMNLTHFLRFEEADAGPMPAGAPRESGEALRVDFEVFDSIGVYKFAGAVDDPRKSEMLLNIINKIIADRNRTLIDMHGISAIDSAGAGVIIRLIKLMRDGKADVRFFGASGALRAILEVNGLNTVIHIFPNREEAIKTWD
jgi:anti-anti-sigma factor